MVLASALAEAAAYEIGTILNDHYNLERYVQRRTHFLGCHPHYKYRTSGLCTTARADGELIFSVGSHQLSVQEVRRREIDQDIEPLLPLPTEGNTETLDDFHAYPSREWTPTWTAPPKREMSQPPQSDVETQAGTDPTLLGKIIDRLGTEAQPAAEQPVADEKEFPPGNRSIGSGSFTVDPRVSALTGRGMHVPVKTRENIKRKRDTPLASETDQSSSHGSPSPEANEAATPPRKKFRLSAEPTTKTKTKTKAKKKGKGPTAAKASRKPPPATIQAPTASAPKKPAAPKKVAPKQPAARKKAAPKKPAPKAPTKTPAPNKPTTKTVPKKSTSAPPNNPPPPTPPISNNLEAIITGTALPSTPALAASASTQRYARQLSTLRSPNATQPADLPSLERPDILPAYFFRANFPPREEDSSVRCVCGVVVDDGMLMVGCDGCGGWQHVACMGVRAREAVEGGEYRCQVCDAWGHRVLVAELARGVWGV